MKILKAGALYFSLVFGAGFLLGPIRILWIVPRLGVRLAGLLEIPLMLLVVIIAARWVVRRFAIAPTVPSHLSVGSIALSMMLVADLALF